MNVYVRDQWMPGPDRGFRMVLPGGTTVTVIIEAASGRREVSVLEPGEDVPRSRLVLEEAQAVTLGTLLSGVGLTYAPRSSSGERLESVQVETVTLGAGSPVEGRLVSEIPLADFGDVAVLAVIRDDTPEIVEDESDRPCQPGDRLVVAGRPRPLEALRAYLAI